MAFHRNRRVAALALMTMTVVLLVFAFRNSGNFLVVDNREKSDAIVTTQGNALDATYWYAMNLLKHGYGRELLVDAQRDRIFFGRSQAEWAREFIEKTAIGVSGQVRVCPITSATTAEEIYEVGNCLKGHSIQTVLLVVDDFHCRRSLAMFRHILPQYRWSIAAQPNADTFGVAWWRKREWVRTAVVEWQHLLWWEMLDRWRYGPARPSST